MFAWLSNPEVRQQRLQSHQLQLHSHHALSERPLTAFTISSDIRLLQAQRHSLPWMLQKQLLNKY